MSILQQVFWAAIGISGYQSASVGIMLILIVVIIASWWFGRPWLEGRLNKRYGRKKWTKTVSNIAASIITLVALVIVTIPTTDKASLSIDCLPVLQPIDGKRGESLWTIFLHPDVRNNQLVSFTFAITGAVWPHPNAHGFGYKCEFINHGGPISHVDLALQVDFGSVAGVKQNRTIEFGFPWPHNDKPFVLYLANCTAWSPSVAFPETGVARLHGTNEKQTISFDLITRRIGGFGIFQETVQYPEFCGVDPKRL